jgi:hypothetical protein
MQSFAVARSVSKLAEAVAMSFDSISASKDWLGPWNAAAAKTPGDVELNMGLLLLV